MLNLDVQWCGDKVECYYKVLKNDHNVFYREFALNGECFKVNDFALISTNDGRKLCQLIALYESSASWHKKARYRGVVKWYTFMKDLPCAQSLDFDENNEVVKDLRNPDVYVSLQDILRKCVIVIGTEDDPVYLIDHMKLDLKRYFSCRYVLEKDVLRPIVTGKISLPDLELTPKGKRKAHVQSAVTLVSPLKTLKLSPVQLQREMTPSRVKRNLNASFDNSLANSPLLNYSIIDGVEEKPLRLKLRVSERQPCSLIVALNQGDRDAVSSYIDENVRRSNRVKTRKSYAEYISPVKSHRTDSTDSELCNTRSARKVLEVTSTPTKRTRTTSTSSTKSDVTPKKVVKNEAPPIKEGAVPKTLSKSVTMKYIRQGKITPSMQRRRTPLKVDETRLTKARAKLHVSYMPDVLSCRENEFTNIYSFVEGKLFDGSGGCMYISGVPGTGKTATVTEVIRNLQEQTKQKFTYVNVNGMRLTEPRQAYVEIYKQLHGKTVPWEQAQNSLESSFTKGGKKKAELPVVLLIDELDILCTKRQDVVYNLLDWPTKAVHQLIVIAIANTMDLPERLLMGRVTSRLGLTRLTFQAYTHKQLQEIILKRLIGTNAFNPDAVQLVARKVASVSGDARRALDICRRAVEIAEGEDAQTFVSMTHVNEALNSMITQPKVCAVKQCSRLEQLILQAMVAEVERTGVEETVFADVFRMLHSVAGINGFKMVSSTLTLVAVAKLSACRLILCDQKSNDLQRRLILNVSSDDIYYALKTD